MTVVHDHIAHHRHLFSLYKRLLGTIEGIVLHENPSAEYDSNYWLNAILLDESLHIVGEEEAYGDGLDACALHCRPNRNVEALRRVLDKAGIESRPLWKPLHLQPVFAHSPCYVNGISEGLFKRGLCLPSGPCVTDEEVYYIVSTIKNSIK